MTLSPKDPIAKVVKRSDATFALINTSGEGLSPLIYTLAVKRLLMKTEGGMVKLIVNGGPISVIVSGNCWPIQALGTGLFPVKLNREAREKDTIGHIYM